MMRFKTYTCELVVYATLLPILLAIAYGLWIGLSTSGLYNEINTLQLQVATQELQISQLIVGTSNATRILRTSGVFEWGGLTGSSFCSLTPANYSVYDIIVPGNVTFTELVLQPASFDLTISGCSNDGNIITIGMTNFDPLPLEVVYLSAPFVFAPMSPDDYAMFQAQCPSCIIGSSGSVFFPGYTGISSVPLSFGFLVTATLSSVLPLSINFDHSVTTLIP